MSSGIVGGAFCGSALSILLYWALSPPTPFFKWLALVVVYLLHFLLALSFSERGAPLKQMIFPAAVQRISSLPLLRVQLTGIWLLGVMVLFWAFQQWTHPLVLFFSMIGVSLIWLSSYFTFRWRLFHKAKPVYLLMFALGLGLNIGALALLPESIQSQTAREQQGHVLKANEALLKGASLYGHVVDVQRALEQGANIQAQQPDGDTALHIAAYFGKLDIIQYLMAQGANPLTRNQKGLTPLMVAVSKREYPTVRYLIKQTPDINQRLLASVELHLLDAFKDALIAGGDVHIRNHNNWTLLHMLAFSFDNENRLYLIKQLVTKGADIDAKNDSGATPLMLAVDQAHFDEARFFIQQGADLKHTNAKGQTVLDIARQSQTYWSNYAKEKYKPKSKDYQRLKRKAEAYQVFISELETLLTKK